tara:strand:- start:352 stop:504 length:153 start_codon:yes stop_codon:yes gene_type:complete
MYDKQEFLESRKEYYMENGIKEEEAEELAERDLFDFEMLEDSIIEDREVL